RHTRLVSDWSSNVCSSDLRKGNWHRLSNRNFPNMETKSVNAVRHFHHDGVRSPFMTVVVEQLQAQPASLNTNCRIGLWIEVVRPPKNFRRNLIFLQRNAGMGDGMVRQIPKQFAERLGFAKSMTVDDSFNLPQVSFFISDVERCNRHVTFKLVVF